MNQYAALDVSLEQTAICVVDETGRKLIEGKVVTCPDAITMWVREKTVALTKVGMETGPLAVWLWNELSKRGLPIVCLDARHASAALSMMPNKTDRHDAAGLARIENEMRGLLKTFGVMFGKNVGGFARRADEIIAEELSVSPELRTVIETLVDARRAILDRIRVLDRRVYALAKKNRTARLFMTAPGVGAITALSVASAYDDPARFARSASAGAYFGLTPRRYESGEVSRNGHVSKRGNRMTRTHLYEAANVILTRGNRFSTLKAWGLRLAKASGFKRAKVAVARKLAVILHAMWKADAPFRYGAEAA
jgi:transposase